MQNKLKSFADHWNSKIPRSAENVDVNRCLAVFNTADEIVKAVDRMVDYYGAFVKFKNGMAWSEKEAEEAMHLRLMLVCENFDCPWYSFAPTHGIDQSIVFSNFASIGHALWVSAKCCRSDDVPMVWGRLTSNSRQKIRSLARSGRLVTFVEILLYKNSGQCTPMQITHTLLRKGLRAGGCSFLRLSQSVDTVRALT